MAAYLSVLLPAMFARGGDMAAIRSVLLAVYILAPGLALAHGGGLDNYGCHNNRGVAKPKRRRFMRAIATLFIVVLLSGCANQQLQQRQAEARQAMGGVQE